VRAVVATQHAAAVVIITDQQQAGPVDLRAGQLQFRLRGDPANRESLAMPEERTHEVDR